MGWPQQRVRGVLGFVILYGIFVSLFGLGNSVPTLMVAAFSTLFVIPIITATNQAIWQNKVAPEVQGRVFAMRYMIAWSIIPLAFILGGPLADGVFRPLLAEEGIFAQTVLGENLGVGSENGIRLLYITLGLFNILTAVAASFYSRLWRLEEELPAGMAEPALGETAVPLESVAEGAD